jgi:capsular polysaccharide transport system permease protein
VIDTVKDSVRSHVSVAWSVWQALFLREAVQRLFGRRAAWLWLLLEPVVHIAFLIFIFAVISLRTVGGIETAVWLMVGLLAFFFFRRPALQGMNAIGSNQALFSYRQVKPVDTVLSRVALEGLLMLLVAGLLFSGAALFGLDVTPADPLAVLEAFVGIWLLGLGFALITSVARELIPELGDLVGLLMTPLYFLSGVIFPVAMVPQAYREWLMYNPVAHGLEAARLGFAPHYSAVPETSIAYLYGFAVAAVFLGLALQVRFASRLVTR